MFSIFISDENNKCVYLVRDRFGIKPLYYFYDQSKTELTFCSEIPVILKILKLKKNKITMRLQDILMKA